MMKYEIGIVGGGPAGYTAALAAAKKGESVILFEKNEIGGTCLNYGCIPTKSILKSSEIYKDIKNSSNFGIHTENVNFDYSKILEQKDSIIQTLKKGIELQLKNAKVEVIREKVEIISKSEIKTENGQIFEFEKIICATGSTPREVKGLEFDGDFILSSDDILKLKELPSNILIVGSGAIGIEWARIFSNFGVKTSVVELAQNLLPLADIDISKRLERSFKTQGIEFFKNCSISQIEGHNVKLSNGMDLVPDKILVSVGRIPNCSNKIEGVTYLGDVAGEIQLAHYASHQAFEVIDGIPMNKNLIPSIIYGDPEIAWVGLREQDLIGKNYDKSTVLYSSLGKSWCDRNTEGIIKIISVDNQIVGAHILGEEASALVVSMTIAIQNKISVDKLKEICYPHPTYSEGLLDAVNKLGS